MINRPVNFLITGRFFFRGIRSEATFSFSLRVIRLTGTIAR